MSNILESLKVSFVIIGTIIGAGFASGQEIYTFFNVYGLKGLLGIFISCMLIGIVIYKTLKISMQLKQEEYEDFLKSIIPEKLRDNKILIFTINNIINIFLLISFFIMVSGFASYFFQEFQASKIYGGIIIAVLSLITFFKDINGIVKINTYLIPILILLVILLGAKQINYGKLCFNNFQESNVRWILSSILYASYNSITLIPMLVSMKKMIKSKKQINQIVTIVTIVMTVLSVIIYFLIQVFIKDLEGIEIPIVYIAGLLGNIYKYLYGFVILVAIFTTAISAGYSFLVNCTKSKKQYTYWAIIMCITSILVSKLSFSGLINLLYPIFGYLGIIQIIFILNLKKAS